MKSAFKNKKGEKYLIFCIVPFLLYQVSETIDLSSIRVCQHSLSRWRQSYSTGTSASELVAEIKVTGGTCATAFNDHMSLQKSWDNNPSTLFHSKSSTDGWAKYDIPESIVKPQRLLWLVLMKLRLQCSRKKREQQTAIFRKYHST